MSLMMSAVSGATILQTLAPLWTPANLAQPPAGWFDAMDASSFKTVGNFRSSYTVWTNKGYKGGQAQTTTDSGQPTRSASSASDNSKPAIMLGSNPLTIDLATNQGAFSSSIFAVARDNTGGEAIVASTGRATDATQDVRTLVVRNGTAAIDFAGGSRFQGSGSASTAPQIVGFTVQQDGAQVTSVWANGVNGGDNFRSSPTGSRVTIGQMPYYTPNPPVQALQELLLFDYLLGTADRQRLEGYLAHRWGTAASLPAAHPYKAAPPRYVAPWTPANLPTAPRLWVRHRNAVWSGNNLASITNAGSAGGSATVGGVSKGDARGGFPGLSLTGSNGVPLNYRFNGMGTGTSTFFAVYRKPTTSPQCLLGSYGHWSPGNGYGVYVDHTENGFLATGSGYGNLFNGAGGDDGPCFHNRDANPTPHDPNDTWLTRYAQVGPVTKTRRDGSSITPYIVKPKSLPTYYGSDTDWSVGSMGGGEFMGAGNSVAELMLFNVDLSQADLEKLEGWAAWEYATVDRLPSGHPYKTAAPTV